MAIICATVIVINDATAADILSGCVNLTSSNRKALAENTVVIKIDEVKTKAIAMVELVL